MNRLPPQELSGDNLIQACPRIKGLAYLPAVLPLLELLVTSFQKSPELGEVQILKKYI